MKKHGLLKTLGILLLLIFVVTCFLPSRQNTVTSLGLADIPVNYFSIVLQNFSYVFLLVLTIGGFYGVLNKIPSYKKLLDTIVTKVKPLGHKFIFLVIILFAVIASLTGMNVQLLVFVPFVVSIIILLGYDKLVALSSTVVSILVGYMGGIFVNIINPNTYGISTYENLLGLENKFANVFPKLLLLLTGIALLIYFVNKHITNVENKKVKYELNDNSELLINEVKGKYKNIKVWPLALILSLTFIIMVLGLIPWSSLFEVTFFEQFHSRIISLTIGNILVRLLLALIIFGVIQLGIFLVALIRKKKYQLKVTIPVFVIIAIILILEILSVGNVWNIYSVSFIKDIVAKFGGNDFLDFALISNLISSSLPSLGSWDTISGSIYPGGVNYIYVSMLVLFITVLIALINKSKVDETIEHYVEGMKKALPAGILITIAYTVLICSYNNGFLQTLISNYGKFNFGVSSLLAFLGCLLNVDMYYITIGGFLPIINLATDETVYEAIAILLQGIYSIFSIVGPTSLILIFGLSYLDIPYTTWLKYIWRFVLGLMILLAVVVAIVVLL